MKKKVINKIESEDSGKDKKSDEEEIHFYLIMGN